MHDYRGEIQLTRKLLKSAQTQNKPNWWRKARIRSPWRSLIRADKRFDQQLEDQQILLTKGRVVWVSLIQANSMLFDRSNKMQGLPGAVLYSASSDFDADPLRLVDFAHGMFDMKGRVVTPAMQAFADKLADQIVADTRLAVPVDYTEGIQCWYASVLFDRKHMPAGFIAESGFPALIKPSLTPTVMMLPHLFWAPTIRGRWL